MQFAPPPRPSRIGLKGKSILNKVIMIRCPKFFFVEHIVPGRIRENQDTWDRFIRPCHVGAASRRWKVLCYEDIRQTEGKSLTYFLPQQFVYPGLYICKLQRNVGINNLMIETPQEGTDTLIVTRLS